MKMLKEELMYGLKMTLACLIYPFWWVGNRIAAAIREQK